MSNPNNVKPLNEDQKQFIRGHYKEMYKKDIAQAIGCTYSQVENYCGNHGLKSGLVKRFEKGHISPSKGKTIWELYPPEKAAYIHKCILSQHRTTKPPNWKPVGTEHIGPDGVVMIKESDKVWRCKYRSVYERLTGEKLRQSDCVIFLDGNKENMTRENMKVVTKSELMFLRGHELRYDIPEMNEAAVGIAKLHTAITDRGKRKEG